MTAYESVKTSPLGFKSAYTCTCSSSSSSSDSTEQSTVEEPYYTTCKVRKKGEACHTIDYIWLPQDIRVRVLALLGYARTLFRIH